MRKRTVRIKRRKPAEPITSSQSRYRFREGHAALAKERELRKYRKRKKGEFELTGSLVLRSLNFLDDEAEKLPVYDRSTDTYETYPVIRPTKLALLLNTSYQTVWRWTTESEQLPTPVLVDRTQGRERMVFHVDEARVIIRAIGEHLNQFKYYRGDHTGTRDRVFSGVEEVRNQLRKAVHGNSKSTRQKARRKTRRRVFG